MSSAPIDVTDVKQWLAAFSQCVRERNIEAGLPLFAADVDAFGTRVIRAGSLPELSDGQWRPTWFRTAGFQFVDASVNVLLSADASQAVVLALWNSMGVDAPNLWETQPTRLREGRCTIVLRRNVAGRLVSTHTHFSLHPDAARPDQLLATPSHNRAAG